MRIFASWVSLAMLMLGCAFPQVPATEYLLATAPVVAPTETVQPTLEPLATTSPYLQFRANICCHGTPVPPGIYALPDWLNLPFTVTVEQEGWEHYNEEAGELFGLVKGNSNSLGIPSETIYIFPTLESSRAGQFFLAFANAKEFTVSSEPSDITLAGFPARQVDLIAKPSSIPENAAEDTPYGVQPLIAALTYSPTGLFWTTWSPEAQVRVLKLDIGEYSAIIYIEAPQVDFERVTAEASAILNTLSPIE